MKIKERIKNKPFKLLSSEYVNSSSLLKWKCTICDTTWKASTNNICSQGQGCPSCGKVHMNITNARRHKHKWENIPARVYIIRCWNKIENFYKIGITLKSVRARFSGALPYNYEVIKEIETNRYKAVFMEISLHDKHRKFSYKPKLSFGGETECFSKILEDF